MLPRNYRERATRVLDCNQWEDLLGPRCGLIWRTHDFGLMRFHCDRLHSQQLREMEKLLSNPRRGGLQPERAVFPVKLMYALGRGRVSLCENPEDARLPGSAALLQRGEDLYCVCADPEAALRELARLESEEREGVLARIMGTPQCDTATQSVSQMSTEQDDVSCGRCGLLGNEHCAGGACVNSRTKEA